MTDPVKTNSPTVSAQTQQAPAATPPPVKQPTMTSANLPSSTPASVTSAPSTQDVLLSDDDIVARPLIDPDFTNLKPRNPGQVFRWVNRVAGTGARFEQMKASGFEVAVYADVKGEIPLNLKKDGHVINGDLILMKISRELYVGALKNNERKAFDRMKPGFAMQAGRSAMKEALNEVPGNAANKGKVKLYEPGL